MSRSRPASNPISYHKYTKQYYITRGGRRIYLGSDKNQALAKYRQLGLGVEPVQRELAPPVTITAMNLANRLLVAQQANWRSPKTTLKCYKDWLGRFIKDHPQLRIADFTVEKFAAWKLSLKERGYSPESINHYLGAVRAMFTFAEETDIVEKTPKLKRIKNETRLRAGSTEKPLYTLDDLNRLLKKADLQLKARIPCYGFYRLRHCASTAMSLVATPHVHRKFMRHSQLQQQVTYTHTPDAEVDKAIMKAKKKLFGEDQAISNKGRNQRGP
ncbi:MAG: phage integrase N-terminal SAM-like domain-containing protein [Sedimentisphaerales bacterium]